MQKPQKSSIMCSNSMIMTNISESRLVQHQLSSDAKVESYGAVLRQSNAPAFARGGKHECQELSLSSREKNLIVRDDVKNKRSDKAFSLWDIPSKQCIHPLWCRDCAVTECGNSLLIELCHIHGPTRHLAQLLTWTEHASVGFLSRPRRLL
eukprot:scaffold32086_cov183-Amphora_coffeaeformis.AAC.14